MANGPTTRHSLILRLRNRDDLEAWQQFAETYQPLLYSFAIRRGFQHSDAVDIVQEVLLRVAGAVDRWDPHEQRGSFRSWLYQIARNFMISLLKQRIRRPDIAGTGSVVEDAPDDGAVDPALEDEFDRAMQREIYQWAARRVQAACSRTTWLAFYRTAVEGRSPAAVAEELGLSPGSVYVARSRIIRRLQAEVAKVPEGRTAGRTCHGT